MKRPIKINVNDIKSRLIMVLVDLGAFENWCHTFINYFFVFLDNLSFKKHHKYFLTQIY